MNPVIFFNTALMERYEGLPILKQRFGEAGLTGIQSIAKDRCKNHRRSN